MPKLDYREFYDAQTFFAEGWISLQNRENRAKLLQLLQKSHFHIGADTILCNNEKYESLREADKTANKRFSREFEASFLTIQLLDYVIENYSENARCGQYLEFDLLTKMMKRSVNKAIDQTQIRPTFLTQSSMIDTQNDPELDKAWEIIIKDLQLQSQSIFTSEKFYDKKWSNVGWEQQWTELLKMEMEQEKFCNGARKLNTDSVSQKKWIMT